MEPPRGKSAAAMVYRTSLSNSHGCTYIFNLPREKYTSSLLCLLLYMYVYCIYVHEERLKKS